MAIDIVLRLTGQDQGGTRMLKEANREAAGLQRVLSGVDGRQMGDAAKQADRLGTSLQKAEGSAGILDSTLQRARNWGAGIAAAGAGALLLSAKFAQAARDVEESENLVKESFGANTEAINAWSDNLQATLGITATSARRSAATFNVMFDSMGIGSTEAQNMSKRLTELAYDMASFYNLSNEDAFQKLQAGITGEAEPLKRLGILIDEQTIKNYAYANGIATAGSELTQQQKVMARYGAIIEQTSKAQGDLARTADSASNTQKRMKQAAERAFQSIGKGSADAQKGIDMLVARVLALAGANETAATTVGWLLTMGGYAATAGGSVLTLLSQVAMLHMAFPPLGVAATTAFTTMKVAAASTIPFLIGVAKALAVPFAILVAGAAAGIAAYEALRALNIGGFGDKTASTGEILEHTRKQLMGDPAAAAEAAAKSAGANAPTVASAAMPMVQAQTTTLPGAGTTEGATVTATQSKQAARSAATQAQRAAKAQQREKAKQDKLAAKVADSAADRQADIEIATLEESYETRIAQLEASKAKKGDNSGIDNQIARLQAEKALRSAEIRAKYDSEQSGALDVARIRYQGALSRIGLGSGGGATGQQSILARLMGGGGVDSLSGASGGAPSTPASGGGGASYTAEVQSIKYNGNIATVLFKPLQILLPGHDQFGRDAFQRATRGYGN